VSTRALIALLLGAMLAGCAAPPPQLRQQFAVRDIP
jgi:starvation-inducible outer membrane lipoprotein